MKHIIYSLSLTLLVYAPAAHSALVPGSAEDAGLTHVVPDTVIYDVPDHPNLDNWEPYTSVMGNSVFLIEANTFAEDGLFINQRFGVALQPAAGGAHVEGEVFFGDDGVAYRGPINASRQNGNPGRVAGDKRPGAKNFITGAEASPHVFPEFASDGRWDLGFDRTPAGRYTTVQTYKLDVSTLGQSSTGVAFDPSNGRETSGTSASLPQISRFGGEVAALDNGNFVVMTDDLSNVHSPGRAATAIICGPDGSIVKETFVIHPAEVWSNLAAHKGGFCVRTSSLMKFFDNDGNLLAEAPQTDANIVDAVNPFTYDTGRGDGTRIASHINSDYVYLAGRSVAGGASAQDVRVAVWNASTHAFITSINVNELTAANGGVDSDDFRPIATDRVGVAVDALNRLTVTYEARTDTLVQLQTFARVLSFNGTSFTHLTPSFLVFVNNGTAVNGGGGSIRTTRPSVSMTTRQICIAAKGEINKANNVEAGPDTLPQATFYTVISHPEPAADPTAPAEFPGGVDSVGLATVKADQVVYDVPDHPNLDNWEPYTSVMGNSVFLIEANTFAEDGLFINQRFGVALQPAAGGAHVEGEVFFGDDGVAYRGPINASRQNGNPGRVAGDKRPGAKNFITGAEASPHVFPEFASDGRWDLGFDRTPAGRYTTVQTFSLNLATLAQSSTGVAFDPSNGRETSGTSASLPQISRFGGEVAALDNGNFVVMTDDLSNVHSPGRAATAIICGPDGSIVKETFVIHPAEVWSNLAAHKGGFCVRTSSLMKFFDNDGNLLGEAPQTDANIADAVNPFTYDTGRGDGTRIASHINSDYVYLAGRSVAGGASAQDVRVAVWNARTRAYIGSVNVNELTPANGGVDTVDFRPIATDRVGVAVDALNRLTVVYEARTDTLIQLQTFARVLSFDGSQFTHLTRSFLVFVNHGTAVNGGGGSIRTTRPSVSMTTKEICVAAKGEINKANNVPAGPDTLPQATFYTVFTHPDPQDDPTGQGGLVITITHSGASVILNWTGGTGPYTVERTTGLSPANWQSAGETADTTITLPFTGASSFFRVIGH